MRETLSIVYVFVEIYYVNTYTHARYGVCNYMLIITYLFIVLVQYLFNGVHYFTVQSVKMDTLYYTLYNKKIYDYLAAFFCLELQ